MTIDFSRLRQQKAMNQFEPRDLFMALPKKDKRYEYPRDVQSEVWKKWFNVRTEKNVIIKMNTGSGKTVVGLLLLLSSLKENAGPAVYVVPDRFLQEQVKKEAESLGISITEDEDDPDYITNHSILLINIHKLVNGKSVFGMRSSENNVKIGSIVIDDVHACLATIENQFTLVYQNGDVEYRHLVELFSPTMATQAPGKWNDILNNKDQYVSMLVPYWAWQNKLKAIHEIISCDSTSYTTLFNYPLLRDSLELCNCVISSKRIEITPKCIPISIIANFEQAKRRIFMSATLHDDSVFVSALGLRKEDLSHIITPDKANDIGDRMILYPQVMNKELTDKDIKIKLYEISKIHNVIVIVPSNYRSQYWSDVADLILDQSKLIEGIKRLKDEKHVGLVILINKYDGIDLPDDACRYLVIDGLPTTRTEFDALELEILPNSVRLVSEQIQKVEQGMGRGVRSSADYCVIVLMGSKLMKILYADDGKNFFSEATRAQFCLSEEIWRLLNNPSIEQIFDLANYIFNRDVEWITMSKERLSSVTYRTCPNVDDYIENMRKAYEFSLNRHYSKAIELLEAYANNTNSEKLKGLIKQNLAEYVNFNDEAKAQEIQKNAILYNSALVKPIQGILNSHIEKKSQAQARYLMEQIQEQKLDQNKYLLTMKEITEDLQFKPNSSMSFENALRRLSFLLGIYSSRPEKETGRGPDNFWELENDIDFVIECKNEATSEIISKDYCNQLNGSIEWYKSLGRSNDTKCYPILIHISNTFAYDASPNERTRIMNEENLREFTDNCFKFAQGLIAPENYNIAPKITALLQHHNLCSDKILWKYTSGFKKKNK